MSTRNRKKSGLSHKTDYDLNDISGMLDKIDKDVMDQQYTSSTNVIPESHCAINQLDASNQLLVQKWVKLNDLELILMEDISANRKLKRETQNALLKIMSDKHINTIKVGDTTLKYEITHRAKPLTIDHLSKTLSKVILDPIKVDKIVRAIDTTRGTTTSQKISRI